MAEHTIKIEGGQIEAIYDDALSELLKAGEATVRRASHVEPAPYRCPRCKGVGMREEGYQGEMQRCPLCNGDGSIGLSGWVADMTPEGGPVLFPFALREEALAAEREWLRKERGL